MIKSFVYHIITLLLLACPFAGAFAFISISTTRLRLNYPTCARGSITANEDTNDTSLSSDGNSSRCRILLLDHLNINHEKGRHDALKAFYFDFLQCSIDPRKAENIQSGQGTLWANLGLHQFHLPEGKPHAQVLDGVITLIHADLKALIQRFNDFYDGDETFAPLKDTEFHVDVDQDDDSGDIMLMVMDPWGNQFCILPTDDEVEDRAEFLGTQPSLEGSLNSETLKLEDLTIYVPSNSNLDGIARFYKHLFGASSVEELKTNTSISIAMGDSQTLTFQYHPAGPKVKVQHEDLKFDSVDDYGFPSNFGPHISLYVSNLSHAYHMAEELNVLYVNPRFKRRAYTEEEAIDQCMFRIIDIIDPLDKEKKVITSLEHEVRAAKTKDGKKYKSCPLTSI